MQYLYYTLGVIVLLTIVFLLVGFIRSSISYTCEILVDKPIRESGYVAQDEERMSEWLDGFIKIEHISGTPKTIGNVSNVYFANNGKEMVVKRTIIDIKPFEFIKSLNENDFMNMEYSVQMKAVGEKTKICSTTTVKGNGMFAKSLMVFMSGSFQKQEEMNLVKLKNTIEANIKRYSEHTY